jgi:hypothetical protein
MRSTPGGSDQAKNVFVTLARVLDSSAELLDGLIPIIQHPK